MLSKHKFTLNGNINVIVFRLTGTVVLLGRETAGQLKSAVRPPLIFIQPVLFYKTREGAL